MLNRIAFLGVLLVMALPVQAHLDAGEDVLVGDYLIDFGYSPESPSVSEPMDVSFVLTDPDHERLDFEELAVTVFLDGSPAFRAVYFPDSERAVSFSHRFQESGVYRIEADFKNSFSETIVKRSFDLRVSGDSSGLDIRILFYSVSLVVLVFLVVKSRLFHIPKVGKKA